MRKFLCGVLFPAIFLIFCSIGLFSQIPRLSNGEKTDGFLRAEGTKLFLGDGEFREIGLNKYDLFLQYLGLEGDNPGAKKTAKRIIADLGGRGFKVIRLMFSPFYPAQFNTVFFDEDDKKQELKRAEFFKVLDELLDDCDKNGVGVVASLLWNPVNLADLGHHSLHEAITDPNSVGYRKFEEFFCALMERYKDKPTVLAWEIGGEFNLLADVQKPEGVFGGSSEGDVLHPGPLVRDSRNNFNSAELRDFFKRTVKKARSVDGNHLITLDVSEPRDSAMHLFRAAISGREPDWTADSPEEREEYILLLEAGADFLTIHWYLDNIDLGWYQCLAQRMGKPILISELGANFKWIKDEIAGADYSRPETIEDLEKKLGAVVRWKIPLSIVWVYHERNGPFRLFYGKTDEALLVIEKANNLLRK